ncbi:MAG: hypothetical protein DRQ98_10150 [Gammaproteobacteria bacterium]|nr:MAG: hypothetical protein DRQ98_10150 [Gammaproteobacteria bacterium]
MGYYAKGTVILGAGKKRETLLPGTCLDGKVKTTELEQMAEDGVVEFFDEKELLPEPADKADKGE